MPPAAFPGESRNSKCYWNRCIGGGDCPVQWPYSRWETEPYYQEGGDSNLTGKAYTCHGGFLTQEMINQFDSELVGIDDEEAKTLVPGQRVSMEVDYQVLGVSGFVKKSLAGNIINPHLNTEAFPVYFDTEHVDPGYSTIYSGVSSFGFGGTNSRTDAYGYASYAHRAAIQWTTVISSHSASGQAGPTVKQWFKTACRPRA